MTAPGKPTPTTAPSTADVMVSDSIAGWQRFWFSPADPTILALIRISTGMIVVYNMLVYGLELGAFMGAHGMVDLEARLPWVRQSPTYTQPLDWLAQASQDSTFRLDKEYQQRYGKPILSDAEHEYVQRYRNRWGIYPPLPFPKDAAEEEAITSYILDWGNDPRLAAAQGNCVWSLWFHVTNPDAMYLLHSIGVVISAMFMLGLVTRLTTPLVWMILLTYIHRMPYSLFGYDTMTLIVVTYLMIAPCGAALSLDRLIYGWWLRRGAIVRARWHGFWAGLRGRPAPPIPQLAQTPLPPPEPSVAANLAIRMLQIHVCIIYAAAGLSKLQGASWWNGTAVWYTLVNSEFAPMTNTVYMWLLRQLSQNRLVLELFLTSGTLFTLFFEIAYAALVWGRRTRWLMLGMAIMLHGVIGLFMGLKTFALIMLIMNMIFLPPELIRWLMERLKLPPPATTPGAVADVPSTAIVARDARSA